MQQFFGRDPSGIEASNRRLIRIPAVFTISGIMSELREAPNPRGERTPFSCLMVEDDPAFAEMVLQLGNVPWTRLQKFQKAQRSTRRAKRLS